MRFSFFPSCQPFSGRLKTREGRFLGPLSVWAWTLFFVSRIAEGMGLDSDRIELVEQRREDRPLHFTTLLWHCGPKSRLAMPVTGCMRRHLSTALAVRLLREYGAGRPKLKRRYGGLPRKKTGACLSNIFKISWTQT